MLSEFSAGVRIRDQNWPPYMPIELWMVVANLLKECAVVEHETACAKEHEWMGKPLLGQLKHSEEPLDLHSSLSSLAHTSRDWFCFLLPYRFNEFSFVHDSNDRITAQLTHHKDRLHLVKALTAAVQVMSTSCQSAVESYLTCIKRGRLDVDVPVQLCIMMTTSVKHEALF